VDRYFPLILIALVFVVLIVLPARQRRRAQAQQQELQNALQPGTPVMTTSGLQGKVARVGDDTVDLEIAPGVVVTFVRRAILEARKPTGDAPDAGTVNDGNSGPADGVS
jgi:preprotein translocase subunit YajC